MIDTTAQAAVVGGSLIAFAGDLPESHREDIYLSTLYAQRATRAAVADGLEGDWFEYYRNTLKFIGWDVPRPEGLPLTSTDSMGRQVIQQISRRLGEVFSSPISRAMAALEQNQAALDLFESSSLTQQAGVFQMIPCIANGPNKIDLGLYHRQFRLYRSAPQFLFAQEQVRESREQMALLTFNTLYYAQFREKVKKAVLEQSLTSIRGLSI
ncbi:hypothetical protein [Pseudomonas sp. IT-P176]|uniref:hypothetical protein n=1 Tax=Pseudomonas sp. IT-P176 TaxID=3026444 RepID=UPI0039E09EE7